MKKYNLITLFVFGFFVTCFCQDPALTQAGINPNPLNEGGTGTVQWRFSSAEGDIPLSQNLEIKISVAKIDIASAAAIVPFLGTTEYFSWAQAINPLTGQGVVGSYLGTQIAVIPSGAITLYQIPITVTGTEGEIAVIQANLGNVNGLTGNNVSNDDSNASRPIDQALPVKFTSFRIDNVGCSQSQLSWATASETNNEGFVVERSFGNLDNFTQVGFVEGAGNSAIEKSYKYTDTYPIDETEAFVYYRLKQVDFDGVSDLSDIIKGERDCSFHIDGFTVTPNPASNETYIKSDVDNEEPKMATVINSNGQIIEKVAIINPSQRLNLNSYLPGVYSIRMEMDGEVVTKRFIKVQ